MENSRKAAKTNKQTKIPFMQMDLKLRTFGNRNAVKDGREAQTFCSRRTYQGPEHVKDTVSGAEEQTGGWMG